jgi:hypothetical protein
MPVTAALDGTAYGSSILENRAWRTQLPHHEVMSCVRRLVLGISIRLRNGNIVPDRPEFTLYPSAVAAHIAKKADVEIIPITAGARYTE